VADYAAHELLSLHELLMDASLQAKEIESHLESIQDPELRQLAERSLSSKKAFVEEVSHILKEEGTA